MNKKNGHIPSIDEMIDLPLPSDAQISPDGEYVAYVVQAPDWNENQYVNQIWLVDTKGGKPRQMTFAKEGSGSPRWSPDSAWLAFTSKRVEDKLPHIYRISPFGGEAERLTELECSPQSIGWSPDGKAIAFTATDPETLADKERKEQFGDYHVEDQDHRRAHLWQLSLDDRRLRKLTGGDELHVLSFDWHPDSRKIVFESRPNPDSASFVESRVRVVDLDTLEVRTLTDKLCGTPQWSPDGQQIAYTRSGEKLFYSNTQLYVMEADGCGNRILSGDFDESVMLLDWGPNGIYFGATLRTSVHLLCLNPDDTSVRQVTPKDRAGWVSTSASFNGDFSRVALVGIDSTCSAEVMVLDASGGGEPTTLTDFNSNCAAWEFGVSETFRWKSTDGAEIEGVLTKPADFDPQRKYPLLVVIHGGPTGTSRPARLYGPERNYYPIHQWVAKGALVLEPNYRGSAGYGEAFRALNVRNLGVGDYWDVISGVDALVENGWVDADRVGSMGWSQGGYISAFITTYSDRFKAVSVGAGISNWMTYYVNTDNHPFTRTYLEATPWDDPDIYAKTSPMTYIKNAKTPTLIQHGELDNRVPLPNAFELYQGLQDMGVETRLVILKGMPHAISLPRLNRQVMQDNFDWFNRFIFGEEPEEPRLAAAYVGLGSGEQREDAGEMPAMERYLSICAIDPYHWARRDGVEYRILSGEYGLLKPEDPIKGDHHQLGADEVSAMAAKVAESIKADGLKKLVIFTPDSKAAPEVLFYVACLQIVAGILGDVSVEHREVTDSDWLSGSNFTIP